MQTITLMVLAIALMIIGYTWRRPAIAITSAMAWLIFGYFSRSLSAATWDAYYVMFVLGICMFFVAFVEGLILRPKKEDTEPEEDIYDRETQEMDEYIERRTKWRERMGKIMDAPYRVRGREQQKRLPPPPINYEDRDKF